MDEDADEIPFSALDVNPDDLRAVVSELNTNETSLKKLNLKLQHFVDLVEHQNSDFHHEDMALSCQIKLIRQAMHDERELRDEQEHQTELMADCLWNDPQQRKEYQLSLHKQRQDLHEKWMIIKYLSSSIEKQLITIQELRTKKLNLAVQLEKDMTNPRDLGNIISMLLCTQHSWEQLNLDVRHSADLAGDHYSVLHNENMVLTNQLESHRQTLDETEKLLYELEDVYRDAAEMEVTIHTEGNRISKLKSENRALRAICETTNREMSGILSENKKKTSKIAKLIDAQRALQQQLEEEYRLFFTKISQDLHENWMIHKKWETSIEEHLTTIQELRTKNKHLEVQLQKAMVFGGPAHVDQPMCKKEDLRRLSHLYVQCSNVEDEQLAPKVEVEKDHEPQLDVTEEKKGPVVDGQTQSWWRRQVKKMVTGVGTIRRRIKRCLGVKGSKKPVARLINVQPANNTIVIMDIDKPSVSVGMPSVSV